MREGVVIFDLAATGRDKSDDNILQLSAAKLSNTNFEVYDRYACPERDTIMQPKAREYHGLTYSGFGRPRLKRNDDAIDDPFDHEVGLVIGFSEWLYRIMTTFISCTTVLGNLAC